MNGEKMAKDQWDTSRGPKMSNVTGRTIFKYQMLVQEYFTMRLPKGAEIIRMDGQDGKLWLWAVVDTEAPDEARTFHMVKCGGAMPRIRSKKEGFSLVYRGCCAIFIQQELMLYVFEEVEANDG